MQNIKAAEYRKPTETKFQHCAVETFLLTHGAVYSIDRPEHRLFFHLGLLRPVRCPCCTAWVLVESEVAT